jgi:hypothetical protein
LKLQTGESLSDFPKSDVTSSTRCQKVLIELRECNSVNILTEGFGFEHQSFLFPFPDCDEKIWISTDRDQQVIIITETN